MSDSVNLSFNNEKDDKENRIEKLVNKNTGDNRLKNLYENVGTRVSKLREINENYELKIKEFVNFYLKFFRVLLTSSRLNFSISKLGK